MKEDNIDYTKVTDSDEVIELLKKRDQIESLIRSKDKMALIKYDLERLSQDEPIQTEEE